MHVMNDLNKLYSPVIKEHNASPYHFQKVAEATTVKAYNPVCGDAFEFYLQMANGKISSLHFHGYGCAVSMASGSVLVKSLEGSGVADAINTCDRFLDSLTKEVDPVPDEWKAFAAVKEFPARHECATLAWMEIRKFLSGIK
jgi:nitrogen fixation protein NifU and related proteins